MATVRVDMKKMRLATADEIRPGADVLIVNDFGDIAGEVKIRGKIIQKKEWAIIHPVTGEKTWVQAEPDWSYADYLDSINSLFRKKRILVWN